MADLQAVGAAVGMNECHVRAHEWYCDALAVEAERFAVVVDGPDPETPVPTCPEWRVVDLIRHVGGTHRWAGQMVRDRAQERLRFRDLEMGLPDRTPDAAWIRTGSTQMIDWLRTADPDTAMWAWGADQHARFWPRRMLHETTVHRADAELALGREPDIDDDVAIDGIDEFLDNLAHAAYFAPGVEELKGDGETIVWRANDRDERWQITLDRNGFGWSHDDRAGDVTLSATAADLVLAAYGRFALDGRERDRFAVSGDRSLLAHWQRQSAI